MHAKCHFLLARKKDRMRQLGIEPLMNVLNRYGGWPLLQSNWSAPASQTIEQLMGQMRSELNEHFLISILVGPDDKNSSVNILLVCGPLELHHKVNGIFLYFFSLFCLT